jgi:hypothetical protein
MAVVVDSARRVRAKPGDLSKKQMFNHLDNDGQVVHSVLSAVVTLVHVGIEVNIRDEAVKQRPRSVDHTVGDLWTDSDCMSSERFSLGHPIRELKIAEWTYAIPRIRLILPGSRKWSVLTCFTIGHKNCTSPPPRGAAPRFFI